MKKLLIDVCFILSIFCLGCSSSSQTAIDAGDQDGVDAGGDQGGGDQGGGDQGADQGGGDQGADQGGGDSECQPTHDKPLGEACNCDDECAPENSFCFADVLNDSGPLYCTIPNCTSDSCPENYQCNDFYVNADPPQPPFCQKCLGGGTPRALGEPCLCDSDCGVDAPDCFKDITDDSGPPAGCTITGCVAGASDNCPGTFECSVSVDMTNQQNPVIYFCKACNPGDHSLVEGTQCGCNRDCVQGAICTRPLGSQDPKTCQMCLGGDPRGFGEACACDSDCNLDFPVCLRNSKYCSVTGCTQDPSLCPVGSHCRDLAGIYSFCEKD